MKSNRNFPKLLMASLDFLSTSRFDWNVVIVEQSVIMMGSFKMDRKEFWTVTLITGLLLLQIFLWHMLFGGL